MLPRLSVISFPFSVLVEVLGSSVLLVLRQFISITSTASEFTLESYIFVRTRVIKVRPSCFSILSSIDMYAIFDLSIYTHPLIYVAYN